MKTIDIIWDAMRDRSWQKKDLAKKTNIISPIVAEFLKGNEVPIYQKKRLVRALGIELPVAKIISGQVLKRSVEPIIPISNKKTVLFPQPKHKPFRSKKTLDAAKGRDCIRCGNENGTIVSAHLTGDGQIALGKGMGGKLSDIFSAFLCTSCHTYFDQYVGVPIPIDLSEIGILTFKLEKAFISLEFYRCVFMTLEIKFIEGIHS